MWRVLERRVAPRGAREVLDIDVRTSKLSLSVWFKQEWTDKRLAFDKQCYGGARG